MNRARSTRRPASCRPATARRSRPRGASRTRATPPPRLRRPRSMFESRTSGGPRGPSRGWRLDTMAQLASFRRSEVRGVRSGSRGGHGADLYRAEERVDERWRVDGQDDDTPLEPDTELAQGVATSIDVRRKLAVADAHPLAADRNARLAHASVRIDKRLGGVVPRGQLGQPRLPHPADYVPTPALTMGPAPRTNPSPRGARDGAVCAAAREAARHLPRGCCPGPKRAQEPEAASCPSGPREGR